MAPQAPEPFHILHNSSGAVTSLTWVVFDGDEYLTSGSEIGTITIWNLKVCVGSKNQKVEISPFHLFLSRLSDHLGTGRPIQQQ